MKRLEKIVDRLIRREPVLFFGFLGLVIGAACNVDPASKWGVVIGAGVTLFQRAYSTSKATAEENVVGARYVGATEQQAVMLAAPVLAKAEATRRRAAG